MDHAGRVGRFQGVCDVRRQCGHLAVVVPVHLIRFADTVEGVFQIAAILHQLHGNPMQSVRFADIVDGDDAGMGQPTTSPCFAGKEIQTAGVHPVRQEQLDGHGTLK